MHLLGCCDYCPVVVGAIAGSLTLELGVGVEHVTCMMAKMEAMLMTEDDLQKSHVYVLEKVV
jgi:hypothetical protein